MGAGFASAWKALCCCLGCWSGWEYVCGIRGEGFGCSKKALCYSSRGLQGVTPSFVGRAFRPQAGIPACGRQALETADANTILQSLRPACIFLSQNAGMRASKFYFLGKGVTPSFVGRASLVDTAAANTILQSLRPAWIFFVPKCRHASMRILGTKKILMNQNSSGL